MMYQLYVRIENVVNPIFTKNVLLDGVKKLQKKRYMILVYKRIIKLVNEVILRNLGIQSKYVHIVSIHGKIYVID